MYHLGGIHVWFVHGTFSAGGGGDDDEVLLPYACLNFNLFIASFVRTVLISESWQMQFSGSHSLVAAQEILVSETSE